MAGHLQLLSLFNYGHGAEHFVVFGYNFGEVVLGGRVLVLSMLHSFLTLLSPLSLLLDAVIEGQKRLVVALQRIT